jgi:hypothetical protein
VAKPQDSDNKSLTLQDIPLVTQTVSTIHDGRHSVASRLTSMCGQINVEIGNLRLFFINDCRELVPLVDARITSLSAQLTQVMPQVAPPLFLPTQHLASAACSLSYFVFKIEGTLNFKLKAQYYNVQYAKWEPVIEPWACEVDVRI